jgi:hypothetical protein
VRRVRVAYDYVDHLHDSGTGPSLGVGSFASGGGGDFMCLRRNASRGLPRGAGRMAPHAAFGVDWLYPQMGGTLARGIGSRHR